MQDTGTELTRIGGDEMPNNSPPVELPAAAAQAAHEFDRFTFSTTNANSHAADHEVTLPPSAAENMADEAKEQVPGGKFIFPTWANLDTESSTNPVELPATAQQAAHDFGNRFTFSATNAHSHAADHEVTLPPSAAENMADEAKEQVPGGKFIFPSTANSDTHPLEHVPEQAAAHLPEEIPLEGLPSEAVENISDTPALVQFTTQNDCLFPEESSLLDALWRGLNAGKMSRCFRT